MPGLPRGLRPQDVVTALERAGGKTRAGRGSHVNIKMPNGQLITIPFHGEVKMGLLRAALRKAGLSTEKFLRLLER